VSLSRLHESLVPGGGSSGECSAQPGVFFGTRYPDSRSGDPGAGSRHERCGLPMHLAAYPECDGLITPARGSVPVRLDRRLASRFSCLSPLCGCGGPACGWRGTVARIVEVAVRAMQREFGLNRPAPGVSWAGGRLVLLSVGKEVASRFAPPFVRRGRRARLWI